MKRSLCLLPVAALALGLSACGGDSDVDVSDAWARPTPAGSDLGAAYFQLEVADDDVLTGATVPSDIADHAEIHEVVAAEMDMDESMDMDASMDMDDDMDDEMGDMSDDEMSGDMSEMSDDDHDMGEMEMDGAMVMQELTDGLPLTGGETVSLEPGGYHVMLIGIVDPLEVGDEFDVTLEFENAEDTTVTVEVAETAP